MTAHIYEACDADNQLCLWRAVEDWRGAVLIARRCDLTDEAWELLLAGALVANRWPTTPTTSTDSLTETRTP